MFSDFFEAKPDAVSNFLASVDRDLPLSVHLRNAQLDARLYGWKEGTMIEILQGLKRMRLPDETSFFEKAHR